MIRELSYEPLDLVEPTENVGAATDRHVSCGECETLINRGNCAVKRIAFHELEECWFAQVGAYCSHCGHWMWWLEQLRPKDECVILMTPDERKPEHFHFTGFVISGPGYIRDAAMVRKQLAEHPECAGVLQDASCPGPLERSGAR